MKYAWIDNHRDEYTVSRLCRVLGVSRTGYCRWRVRPPSPKALANEAPDAKVALIHRDNRRSYGRPRITQQLRQLGASVSAERVHQSLKRQGLRPAYRRAWVVTADSGHRLPVAPNIFGRRFDGWQPNRAWATDITYVATDEDWLYLAAVRDPASRRIVGWSMSERIDAELVCMALGQRTCNAPARISVSSVHSHTAVPLPRESAKPVAQPGRVLPKGHPLARRE